MMFNNTTCDCCGGGELISQCCIDASRELGYWVGRTCPVDPLNILFRIAPIGIFAIIVLVLLIIFVNRYGVI